LPFSKHQVIQSRRKCIKRKKYIYVKGKARQQVNDYYNTGHFLKDKMRHLTGGDLRHPQDVAPPNFPCSLRRRQRSQAPRRQVSRLDLNPPTAQRSLSPSLDPLWISSTSTGRAGWVLGTLIDQISSKLAVGCIPGRGTAVEVVTVTVMLGFMETSNGA
jgi:hypothetical protein